MTEKGKFPVIFLPLVLFKTLYLIHFFLISYCTALFGCEKLRCFQSHGFVRTERNIDISERILYAKNL